MKTILVLAQNPELPGTIRTALELQSHRIIHRPDVEEAEPLLKQGSLDACLVDADQPQVQALWIVERCRELCPSLPVLVFSVVRSPEWEEQMYLRGVAQVLSKPVRPRLLQSLIERLPGRSMPLPRQPALRAVRVPDVMTPAPAADTTGQLNKLEEALNLALHAFSPADLLRQLLERLRKVLHVRKAAAFLRNPASMEPGQADLAEHRRLYPAVSVGVTEALFNHCVLSLDTGCGAALRAGAVVLTRESSEAWADPHCLHEMDLLGMDAMIALTDGDSVLGALAFGGGFSGEVMTPQVLSSLFFLTEPLARTLVSVWASERLMGNHGMMADILRELGSACVVVGKDLRVLHANGAAVRLFMDRADSAAPLAFPDLPQELSGRVYQVLKTGNPMPPFKYRSLDHHQRLFQVSIVPFQSKDHLLPASVLLMMEDQTQSDQLKRLEVEAANLRLVRTMADRLAHEIGNALVPISTHQQLLPARHKDAEFRVSLENALAGGVKRIGRLVNQMVFLAQDHPMSMENLLLEGLLEESFREAQRHLPIQTSQLRQSLDPGAASVLGDRAAIKHALSEVFMNAMQANPAEASVAVRGSLFTDEAGVRFTRIDVMDNGDGFTLEVPSQATDAFFTTRSVGLGLGLTVARKVAEAHRGRLEIAPPERQRGGMVSLLFPAEPARELPA